MPVTALLLFLAFCSVLNGDGVGAVGEHESPTLPVMIVGTSRRTAAAHERGGRIVPLRFVCVAHFCACCTRGTAGHPGEGVHMSRVLRLAKGLVADANTTPTL